MVACSASSIIATGAVLHAYVTGTAYQKTWATFSCGSSSSPSRRRQRALEAEPLRRRRQRRRQVVDASTAACASRREPNPPRGGRAPPSRVARRDCPVLVILLRVAGQRNGERPRAVSSWRSRRPELAALGPDLALKFPKTVAAGHGRRRNMIGPSTCRGSYCGVRSGVVGGLRNFRSAALARLPEDGASILGIEQLRRSSVASARDAAALHHSPARAEDER